MSDWWPHTVCVVYFSFQRHTYPQRLQVIFIIQNDMVRYRGIEVMDLGCICSFLDIISSVYHELFCSVVDNSWGNKNTNNNNVCVFNRQLAFQWVLIVLLFYPTYSYILIRQMSYRCYYEEKRSWLSLSQYRWHPILV